MASVAIIGGGPAGTMAAARLGGGGFATAVFEERLGWEKPCGGGLPARAVHRYPFLTDATDSFKVIREAEFIAPSGESVRLTLRQPLLIYSRRELNRLLLRRAAEAGAKLIEDRILNLQREPVGWHLEGRRHSYHADFVIVAAGACTLLRNTFADRLQPRDFMLTLGYYLPLEEHLLRVQFFDAFEGYAWAFPRQKHLSVGICGKAGANSMRTLRERLTCFMERHGYTADSAGIYSHLLPSLAVESWSRLRLAGDRWALAGDAAGLVDPLTGEGIYYAMRSGELLAESLLAGSLESYPERVWDEFGRALALGARVAPYFYRSEFLGDRPAARLIQLAQQSPRFSELLQDLVSGLQPYAGLDARLYRTLPLAALEAVAAALGAAFQSLVRLGRAEP